MNAAQLRDLESYHFCRLRELDKRLSAAQTPEQEETIQVLIDAENKRWQSLSDGQ